ncbi:MAG: hypothetical protein L6Q97_10355 [Thermoanaerobaculia bacterium]|nr:hypothetical protein [Thermoanaerobaculia bacterium]
MVYVTSITDEAVLSKIDTQYVMSKFSGVDLNVVIVFICTNDNWRKEDTWKHKGETYYAIRLPYQLVKETEDVRPLMLKLVAEKLGIPVPAEKVAAEG